MFHQNRAVSSIFWFYYDVVGILCYWNLASTLREIVAELSVAKINPLGIQVPRSKLGAPRS